MNWEALEPSILLPAFAAGMLVLATHIPLGEEVLRRGIVFIDLAVAQFAGLGLVAAHAFDLGEHPWTAQAAAFGAALLGAFVLHALERRNLKRQEALIGVSFVAAACLAILVLAKDPHSSEHMAELLVGQILWTTWTDLLPLAAATVAMWAVWYGLGWRRSSLAFYLIFAAVITLSVQIVGVYLVFASLIVPVLATRDRSGAAYAVGVVGYAAGLLLSALADLPSGAAIVIALILAGLGASAMLGHRPSTVQ